MRFLYCGRQPASTPIIRFFADDERVARVEASHGHDYSMPDIAFIIPPLGHARWRKNPGSGSSIDMDRIDETINDLRAAARLSSAEHGLDDRVPLRLPRATRRCAPLPAHRLEPACAARRVRRNAAGRTSRTAADAARSNSCRGYPRAFDPITRSRRVGATSRTRMGRSRLSARHRS